MVFEGVHYIYFEAKGTVLTDMCACINDIDCYAYCVCKGATSLFYIRNSLNEGTVSNVLGKKEVNRVPLNFL